MEKRNASTLKTGALSRSVRMDRAGLNKEARTITVRFSTEMPVTRWFGEEILSHDPGAVKLERFNNGAAVLCEHDENQRCGITESATITPQKNGEAVIRFARTPLGDQVMGEVEDGTLRWVSVGYVVNRFEVSDDEEKYRAIEWEPLEVSFVGIPADTNSKVLRSNGHEHESMIMKRTLLLDAVAETGGNGNASAALKMKEDLEQRAKDNDEIQDLAFQYQRKHPEIVDIARKAVKERKQVKDFMKSIMEITSNPATSDATIIASANGVSDSRSLGARFVESDSFKKAVTKRAQGERVASLDVEYSILGVRGKVEMAKRAGFTSSDLTAINVQIQTGVIGLGVQRLTVMDLIAPGQTGAAAIIYPRENSFGTVDGVAVAAGAMPRAKSVGERGIKPNWEPDLTTETANVRKVAITTKVPDEFMADFPAARSYIDERLPFMVDTETEFQVLYGDGLGNNLKGIFSTAGVQTRAITTTDDSTVAMSLMKGLTDVRVNSFFEPDAYAFHPYDWETAKLLRDANRQFLAGGPYYIPFTNGVFVELNTFWGKPVVVSTAVTYGKPVAGCWKLGAQYFMREGMRVEMTNANEDDFRRNLIMLRAEHRLALAVYRPVTFIEFTGMPART